MSSDRQPEWPSWVAELLGELTVDVPGIAPVSGVYLHGSLVLDDFQDGRSDLDVVVLLAEPLTPAAEQQLVAWHSRSRAARAAALHVSYVGQRRLDELDRVHPRWAHQRWERKPVSVHARTELHHCGIALLGPAAGTTFAAVDSQLYGREIRAEAANYWLPKTRGLLRWRDDIWVDIGLTSAVRAQAALAGEPVISKSAAIERLPGLGVPDWLVADLRDRRHRLQPSSTRSRLRRALVARREVARLFAPIARDS